MHTKTGVIFGGIVAVYAFTSIGEAVTLTGTLPVSAIVKASCQNFVSGTLNHGDYDPASVADNDAQATLTLQCTNTTPLTLSASSGSGSLAQRQLSSGANRLNYNLFTSSARLAIWGDGTGGTSTIAATGVGMLTNVSLTIFSRIPKGQSAAIPGTYSDSITITVTY